MSTVAVFVALGGTGYAAIELGRDAVRSKNIARGAVGTSELRDKSVRSADVRDRSLRRRDLRPGVLPRTPGVLQVTGSPGWSVPTAFIPVAIPGLRLVLPARATDEVWALSATVQLDGTGGEIVCDLGAPGTPPGAYYSQVTLREGASSLSVAGRSQRGPRPETVALRCALRPDEPGAGAKVVLVAATLTAHLARYEGPER